MPSVLQLGLEKDIDRLRQAAILLEAENKRLVDKNLELTRELLKFQGLGAEALQLRLMQLEEQLAQRNRDLFGKSSERRPGEASGAAPAVQQEARPKTRKTGHGPREQKTLPIVVVPHTLDEPDKVCPSCGGMLAQWEGQTEDSEEIDVIERSFVIKKHKRQKYRCACTACVETAPGPVKLQEGARYSIDFAIEVATAKFADHLPLERQVRIFKREGLEVDSQTLWDQTNVLAKVLHPLHEKLHKVILAAPVIGADETRWELLKSRGQKPGDAGRWFDWTLSSPDGIYHHILETRSTEDAKRVLPGYKGVVMADGYGVYQKLQKERQDFDLGACWAHVRRGFVKAEPNFPEPCGEVLELIRKLYAVESRAPGEGEADLAVRHKRRRLAEAQTGQSERELAVRHERRQSQSAPLVAQIQQWAFATRPKVLPESSLGKALSYMLNLWPALTLFLNNPRIPLDNNATERGLRGLVVGRKNHYGSRSRRGTEVASLFYSLIETCKLFELDPKAYLRAAAFSKLRNGEDYPLPHQIAALARAGPGSPAG